MYYIYTHPNPVDIMPQEEYDILYARVLDGLGITEMSFPSFKALDVPAMKERLSRILGQLSPDLPSEHETELVDLLYAGIFESLDGGNFADNQTGFTSLRSCAGKLGDVVEYYKSRDRRPLTDLSVIGTMDASDFEYVRTSLSGLCSLDLSDAITVGNDDSEFYVIPDRAFFREDGAIRFDQVNLHDSTRKIGEDAFRGCPNLDIVFLSKELRTIGPGAFSDCPSLRKLILPKNVGQICGGAFSGCGKLKSVLCLGTVPSVLGEGCFERSEDSRLIVPVGSREAYLDSSWSTLFPNIYEDNTGDMDNYRIIKEARRNHIGYTPDEKRAVIRMMQAMSDSDNMPHYSESVLINETGVKVFDMLEQEVEEARSMSLREAVGFLARMTRDKKDDLLRKVHDIAEADGGFTTGEKELYKMLKDNL